MKKFKKRILVTGGAGFIGSHLVRYMVLKYTDYQIINLDCLTYAGNLKNLIDIEDYENYLFEKKNINDIKELEKVFKKYLITDVIHLAAESHVDRSITDPFAFIKTNTLGTLNLLHTAKSFWKSNSLNHLFYHVSTDEVYGSLGTTGFFTEKTAYDPRSPYSSSKASSDHFVRAYYHTYKLPIKISNCSNNYGPNQFPEKLIPLCINNIKNKKNIPIYGKGDNIRDWLWVEDHVKAIDIIFHKGGIGETYNIGGNNESTNLSLIKKLCVIMDKRLGRKENESSKLIKFVEDRVGHDKRYAIDTTKIKLELDWEPLVSFEKGLSLTVDWYLENSTWLEEVTSGDYLKYYENQYKGK